MNHYYTRPGNPPANGFDTSPGRIGLAHRYHDFRHEDAGYRQQVIDILEESDRQGVVNLSIAEAQFLADRKYDEEVYDGSQTIYSSVVSASPQLQNGILAFARDMPADRTIDLYLHIRKNAAQTAIGWDREQLRLADRYSVDEVVEHFTRDWNPPTAGHINDRRYGHGV